MSKVGFQHSRAFANLIFRCANLNFSSRTKCNGTLTNGEVSKIIICSEPHFAPQGCLLARPEFEKYGVALVRSKMMHKEGDWNCFRCGNVNFQVSQSHTNKGSKLQILLISRSATSATNAACLGWTPRATASGWTKADGWQCTAVRINLKFLSYKCIALQ